MESGSCYKKISILMFLLTILPGLLIAAEKTATKSTNLDIFAQLYAEYVSNLYNVPNEKKEAFEQYTQDGERYDGMQGPADIRTTVKTAITGAWKLAEKRYYGFTGQANYKHHLYNNLANYLFLKAGFFYDLSKKGQVKATFALIPDRFKKNYAVYPETGKEYNPANYTQWEAGFSYKRQLTKGIAATAQYKYINRSFEAPFSGRDRKTSRFMLLGKINFLHRFKFFVSGGYESAANPGEPEPKKIKYMIDRSFNAILGRAELDISLPAGWGIFLISRYRQRYYTSEVAADTLYFERKDKRWQFAFRFTKDLQKNLILFVKGSFTKKTSNRIDEEEDTIYDKDIIGIGLAYSF